MSAELIPFVYKDMPVRTVDIDGEPWFVGLDICRILDIRDHKQALARLDTDELRGYTIPRQLVGDQAREMTVVSEPGVYRLVFTSRKAEAEEFKRWLAHEVLPQIRKTGRFAPTEAAPIDALDDRALGLLNVKLDMVKVAARLRGPAAGAQMWTHLGLPEPTARGKQATRAHNGAACLAHLLAARDIEGRALGKLLEAALGVGDAYEEFDIGVMGVRLSADGEGVIFANGHDALAKSCERTPWADGRWSQALRRLPGAMPAGAQRFAGVTCRGTFVPADVILDAATALDPR